MSTAIPGPWLVNLVDGDLSVIRALQGQYQKFEVVASVPSRSFPTATMLAAAPELFECVRGLMSENEGVRALARSLAESVVDRIERSQGQE